MRTTIVCGMDSEDNVVFVCIGIDGVPRRAVENPAIKPARYESMEKESQSEEDELRIFDDLCKKDVDLINKPLRDVDPYVKGLITG